MLIRGDLHVYLGSLSGPMRRTSLRVRDTQAPTRGCGTPPTREGHTIETHGYGNFAECLECEIFAML
jgi:hypothetical protein